ASMRERGIEAWAIGDENQLELSIARPASAPRIEAATPDSPTRENHGGADTPEALRQLTATADAIHATAQRTQKVELLAGYLTGLPEEAAGHAAVFFSARAFPQSDGRTLGLGWALLKRAVLEAAGLSEAEYRAQFRRFPDAGDATAAMFASRQPRGAPVSLGDLAAFLSAVAEEPAPAAKLERTAALLPRLAPAEAKYLVKLVTGDLRIGLKEGLIEEAIALATGRPVESVREANMLCGDLALVTRAARAGRLGEIQLKVFHPLQFMLASPEPTAEAILERLSAPVWLEEKYDGIRCQVHKLGDHVELYSRDLKRITTQFPDLARTLTGLPADVILDGELLAWRDGRALPFAELQRRLGRKGDDFFLGAEVPVSLCAYDLLWVDGASTLGQPLRERRAALESLATRGLPASLTLAPRREAGDAVEIEAAFLAAKARGNEGLMAKDPASPYTPGRRGLAWLKLKKAAATLDVVVVAVEFGHGRRRDVLSDYTFAIRDDATGRLLTVGKAYSGLTDEEIARLTPHFLERTLEERGRRRLVVPDVVLEIAFDSIQPSDRHESGFALRFPRIARIRTDKTPAEIDTLATCRRLAGAGFGTAATPG
ncbi:MAG: ATP-dependent DNA ligase, partial [Opitutaceae bacterium]